MKQKAISNAAVKRLSDGSYEAWLSRESVDRDGDIILAAGIQLTNYLGQDGPPNTEIKAIGGNPVVLFSHAYNQPPIGRAISATKVPGQGVKLRFEFAPPGANSMADTIHRLWDAKFINALSIGFMPLEVERRRDSNGEEMARGYLYKSIECLESSIVQIPAASDALAIRSLASVTKGMSKPQQEQLIADLLVMHLRALKAAIQEARRSPARARSKAQPVEMSAMYGMESGLVAGGVPMTASQAAEYRDGRENLLSINFPMSLERGS